ncbi:hypothetical protein CALCODRAFT_56918 [Calocera cornea HHB12733]|uniref:Uncharacterized protein n=1 Tax=Calocera cornea HHB12733 TaxID=1353952 RepID=A0A165DPR7_9BASI|nr:hypothetical protein CALCODRAFT_56918 [Calocera cornea HHB12733]
MMRSASSPYMQCRTFGSYPGCALACRMYSMILCSPSPGTSWPESTTCTSRQLASSVIFLLIKYLSCSDSFAMNSVPATDERGHEGQWRERTRRDAVAVERLLVRELLSLPLRLLADLLRLLGAPKPPAALLVHLCARRHPINSHEEELLGLDLAEEEVDVGEDGGVHLLLRQPEVGVPIVRVRALVDHAVEVEVQVVELGDLVLLDELRGERVPLAEVALACI